MYILTKKINGWMDQTRITLFDMTFLFKFYYKIHVHRPLFLHLTNSGENMKFKKKSFHT